MRKFTSVYFFYLGEVGVEFVTSDTGERLR